MTYQAVIRPDPDSRRKALIADATGGDLQLSKQLRDDFVDEILTPIPADDPLRITRREVMAWMTTKGIDKKELANAARRVVELTRTHGASIAQHKRRLAHVQEAG